VEREITLGMYLEQGELTEEEKGEKLKTAIWKSSDGPFSFGMGLGLGLGVKRATQFYFNH